MDPSTALSQFMTIFFTACQTFAGMIVPLVAITWAVRVTSDLLRGSK